MKIRAILFDLGDTIISEESEIKDATTTTLCANLIPGMDKVLKELRRRGYLLGLVADTKAGTYKNVLRQHGLHEMFSAFAISEEVKCKKPAPEMFVSALSKMGVMSCEYSQVIMVGNNLQRDVTGANRLGLISVWFHWNDRYATAPMDRMEQPQFVVSSAEDILQLISRIEASWWA